MTFVLGLTGGISTGKSTVSQMFSAQQIPVIDADLIAREVVEPGTTGLKKITEVFGQTVLQADGSLHRKKLGELVFSSPEKLAQLNDILGLEIRQVILARIDAFKKLAVPLVVVDIPLLYESGYEAIMDAVMVVYVPQELQLDRLMKRDHLTPEQAQARLESQWPIDSKKERADILIDNSGSITETKNQVDNWLQKNRETL
ncbi:dephospho-CoA kinase [Vagococcus zengguangii]|uniref:Dephospho-CoA kinase n=1 Tax=Vagococcus zengguangii TaxID=2571750 RepID=A0A4D7CPJ4_9ENTE|nr:dephospho-CoA kinase [Vagococcus zengguangii]QCI86045.1 dephospho-CoA kinase [Vagococcus zengguangii]TLG80212.1 dephospho-CoA kinase [Vagococcus zengguangii]